MTTPAGPSSSLQPHSTVMKNTNEKNTLEAWRNWELMNGGTDFDEPDPFDVTRTPRSIENDSDGDDADNDNDDCLMISPHACCRHMILCALNVLFCIYAKLMLFTLARRHPDCTRSLISA